MEAFDILGDPVRRRILELLAPGERAAGDVASEIQAEFGLTQPAVSRHLRVLRESGFASVRPVGTRRLYALDAAGLEDAEGWLADLRAQWSRRLDALGTELARGRRRNPDRLEPGGRLSMNDLIAELERVRRSVASETAPDGPVHVVELRRTYDVPTGDVWDACTNPERIPRWFLPISGDLRPGGRFQLEGNAGGEITECEPPRRLAVTWEFSGDTSLVTLDLTPAGGDATELLLRHAVGDNDHWATYGPGATGVGWDLALLGLTQYLRTGALDLDPEAFQASPEALEFMRRSAADWGAAHVAAGTRAEIADEAAARTSAAYAPESAPS